MEAGNNEHYKEDLYKEEDEMNSQEYLGTFRWKKSIKFPLLSSISEISNLLDYSSMNSWAGYLEQRLNFEIEPFIIDGLSYPLSVVYAIETLRKSQLLSLNIFREKLINVIVIGASYKGEERIALESNYFDEIFYYFAYIKQTMNFKLNLYLVGEEISTNNSYTSTKNDKLTYHFYKGNTGDFLKVNALEFSKNNTIFTGLNCGFGAGYLKLTMSWIKDLIKLLKFNYTILFTYTNTYEDMLGEYTIFEEVLKCKIQIKNEDNPFKSMTTYKNAEELWSCGNYGFYVVTSYEKEKINEISKMSEDKLRKEVSNALENKKIQLK